MFTYSKVEKIRHENAVVEVIERIDNLALIKSGVKKGEVIIAAGTGNVKPGTAVKPKKSAWIVSFNQ
ncbi:hypothetical protein [Chryseobacterium indoltheticum]|uniref:hypothetical protein n=1 Tax=Chryseobacterium indoltheticum TaxID=254 RepID=UPI003F490607